MDEEAAWVDARTLFQALRDHEGADVYAAVVQPWLARAQSAYREELSRGVELLAATAVDGPDERCGDLLWELYALSRVSDVLLTGFQPPGEDVGVWPAVSRAEYLRLFTGLGLTPFEEVGVFDPFLHEIVEVEQTEDPDEPVRITEVVWPGLWFGSLLFGRAGVRVRAGARHAERGVADRSPLYWTYLRRHRPTVDLSQGWGHNSQWRTDFRVDLRTAAGDEVNACGRESIDAEDWQAPALSPGERRELLRHRCLVRTPADASALTGSAEFFPFDWHG
ncbi:hypothetical protein [Streptomyces sp. S.PB5]|uniref:hypothetical protein n=1 Tax=Streptomyces sp. S.PB5 TaxID=3020844 RepID=UPI0025AECE5E|nr:hypothetical protein [Streptomyces sp. S.PB5]MDN3029156.1 hypothetical protein [Streptomyces sp. S.PB5]